MRENRNQIDCASFEISAHKHTDKQNSVNCCFEIIYFKDIEEKQLKWSLLFLKYL